MDYLRRIADGQLSLRLEAFGAVQIKGPKWCGKTTTAEQQAKSVIKMQDPDTRSGYLATAKTKPSLLLKGETPRLIDEWQVAPVLWDAVRSAVDERRSKGQFILTGSTVIKDDNHATQFILRRQRNLLNRLNYCFRVFLGLDLFPCAGRHLYSRMP